jgi:Family of unknown function (DUF6544)
MEIVWLPLYTRQEADCGEKCSHWEMISLLTTRSIYAIFCVKIVYVCELIYGGETLSRQADPSVRRDRTYPLHRCGIAPVLSSHDLIASAFREKMYHRERIQQGDTTMATVVTQPPPITARAKHRFAKTLTITSSILAALAGLGWTGLQIQPAPFPTVAQPSAPLETIPLPAGLPAPVARFYDQTYGERIPVIRSAVITGRGTLRLNGLTLPVRFRFTHEAGQSYRHYIEATLFGLPLLKVNEYYVNNHERMVFPWGVQEDNPKLDQGGNLGMWAEALRWLPALLITDPRVRWEPLDDETALLIVPFGKQQERFVVRFDPSSGQIRYWEVMRYKDGSGEKMLWVNGAWFDDGRPWAVFDSEEVAYNVAVDTSFATNGP